MCIYIKKISARRYIALAAIVKFRIGGPKMARNEQVCVHHQITGSKFSKISLGLLCTGGTVVVHLYCRFSLRSQVAPQRSAKFRTERFFQFRSNLRKDSVTNRFGRRFRRMLAD